MIPERDSAGLEIATPTASTTEPQTAASVASGQAEDPSALLRRAARHIRDTIHTAQLDHEGLWSIASALTRGPLAKHLDLWNPGVALAVADWLGAYADLGEHQLVIQMPHRIGKTAFAEAMKAEHDAALAVARLVLGEEARS